MEIKTFNMQGAEAGVIEISDDVFGAEMNGPLVHQVVVGQLANARQGTAKARNRTERNGGGRKPWPQKHTGRARSGSIRAPQFRGGGIVFPPLPRSYRQNTPKRVRRMAIRMTLSDKVREGKLIVLDSLAMEQPKTKLMVNVLAALNVSSSVLLVADGAGEGVRKAAGNIPNVDMLPASLLNTVDVMNHDTLVMTIDAVRKAEELWGGVNSRRVTVSA